MNLKENIKKILKEFADEEMTYFETAQGSKYIRTSDGRLRRWKSYHKNTEGVDQGFVEWSEQSFFVEPKYEREGNIIYRAMDDPSLLKDRKLAFTKDAEGKLAVLISDGNKWVPLKYEEFAPNFVKLNPSMEGKTVAFKYSKTPKIGYHVVDFSTKPSTTILSSFHFGRPVSFVRMMKKEDKDLFGI